MPLGALESLSEIVSKKIIIINSVTNPSIYSLPAHPQCGTGIVCYGHQMLQPAEHWLL